MLTASGPGGVSPPIFTKLYAGAPGSGAPVRQVPEGKYDCVQLSPAPEGEKRFCLEFVGRLSQEVRATVTTHEIQTIRNQVHVGQYDPDPMSIAARILLWESVE